MTMSLVKREMYPQAIRERIQGMGRGGVMIANRWMLGWPGRVEKLIQSGQYLTVLAEQLDLETDALVENRDTHLSETEKVQMAGISLECPIAES